MDHWPWMKFKAEKTPDAVHCRAYSPATISAGGFSHPNKLGRVLFAWINRRTEAEFPINQRISPTPQQLAINSGDFSTFKDFKVELSYFAQDRIFKNMSTTATFRCCHPVLLNIKGSPTISGITPCLITGLGQKMVLSHPHHPMNNLRHDMAWPHPGFKVLWCYPILHYHHVLPPWFPFTPWHHSAKPCPCCEWLINNYLQAISNSNGLAWKSRGNLKLILNNIKPKRMFD